MAPPCPYSVLGLPVGASPEEVRSAYLALARKLHPDKAEGDKAAMTERFKAVAAAYALLTDPAYRTRRESEMRERQANQLKAQEQEQQRERMREQLRASERQARLEARRRRREDEHERRAVKREAGRVRTRGVESTPAILQGLQPRVGFGVAFIWERTTWTRDEVLQWTRFITTPHSIAEDKTKNILVASYLSLEDARRTAGLPDCTGCKIQGLGPVKSGELTPDDVLSWERLSGSLSTPF